MLLALTPKLMNAAYFLFFLGVFSWAAHDGSLKRKMYLFSSCTGKTWWALREQTEGDSVNDAHT